MRLRWFVVGVFLLWPAATSAQSTCTVATTPSTYANGDRKLTVRCPKQTPGAKGDTLNLTRQPRLVYVPAGGDLRAAVASAVGGDIIELQAGATYPELTAPVHPGDVDVTVRTRAALPDRRLLPTDQPMLATLASTQGTVPALTFAAGAHHWRFEGIAFSASAGQTWELVSVGNGEDPDPSHMPHHLTFDRVRCFVSDAAAQRRCFGLNGNDITVSRSDVRNIKEVGFDSQAIGWRQGDRIAILDNYLEAAGENIMVGGADPGITNAVPSDIRIEGNTLEKPVAWRGSSWQVKNLFELKNARRVTVRRNTFRYSWAAAQGGYAVVLTPRNESGTCPWCTVEDVTVEQNDIRDVASGFNILGTDDLKPSGIMNRVAIRHNVVRVNAGTYGGDGRCFQIGAGPRNLLIDHNTCVADGSAVVVLYGMPMSGFVFTNNVMPHNLYGLIGDSSGIGSVALARYAPDAVFLKNVFAGGAGQTYPATTLLPSVATFQQQFVAYPMDLRLTQGSAWIGAGTDGQDLGAVVPSVTQPG